MSGDAAWMARMWERGEDFKLALRDVARRRTELQYAMRKAHDLSTEPAVRKLLADALGATSGENETGHIQNKLDCDPANQ